MNKLAEFSPLPADFEEAMRKRFSHGPHFLSHLGMNLVAARRGWARVEAEVSVFHLNVFGAVHGGVIFSLVDTAMGAALAGSLEAGETMATVEAKINYIRPVMAGKIFAEAAVIHHGRRTVVLEAGVSNSDGVKVAHAVGTYLVMNNREESREA